MRVLFKASSGAVLAGLVSLSGVALAQDGVPYVAGTSPDQRPQGAPIINSDERGGQWYARALTGVSTPYPYSLRFLEDQGNWYTPFNRPGMTGPYDIRRWHGEK